MIQFIKDQLGSDSLIALGARFSIVGILATLAYFIVSNILIYLTPIAAGIASIIAYVVGMVVSFLGQRQFTFRVKARHSSQILRFIVMSAIGLAISYWSVLLVRDIWHWPAFWGTVITSVSIPLLSFVMMKFWVFKEPAANNAD